MTIPLRDLLIIEDVSRRLIPGLVGKSRKILDICDIVARAATTDASLLILGESGTGKDVIARAVHEFSDRSHMPFVAVNCAAIPQGLLESEFFGHERGAYTGADKRTIGRIEQARGGTLFFDEVGDMPLFLQSKLLRFLQDHTFQRVGGREDISVDLRIVAASNRDIERMVVDGTFREDLYYRLSEVGLFMPPLRQRGEDSVLIAEALLRRFASLFKKGDLTFSPDALRGIGRYEWPGNVRELENRVKRAVVLGTGHIVSAEGMGLSAECSKVVMPVSLREARRSAEVAVISDALQNCDQNPEDAAVSLGISRRKLDDLLTLHKLRPRQVARHKGEPHGAVVSVAKSTFDNCFSSLR